MHSTPKPPVLQPEPTLLIGKKPAPLFDYLGVCPDSQTLLAFSITHQAPILFVLPCNTWRCRTCAERKIKKLACDVVLAEPNRLLTLTVNPAQYASRKEAWEKTRKQVSILIRKLRLKFGEIEYMRVTEVTGKGWPHFHLLVRSGYLPHSVVKAYWKELTGAYIVDIRQVHKTFSAYKYLVKYLSKLHTLEWTDRHVSFSRHFVQKPETTWKNEIEYAEPDFRRAHPVYVMLEYHSGDTLVRLSQHAFLLRRKGCSEATFAADSLAGVRPGS